MRLVLFIWFLVFGVVATGQNDTAYTKVFGNEKDESICRVEKYLNGFISVGTVQTEDKESDFFVEFFDSSFVSIKKLELGTEFIESATDFLTDSNGNIFICGVTNSWGNGSYDGYLAMLDSSLTLKWENTFGGEGWDKPIGIVKGVTGQSFICIEKNENNGEKVLDFISFNIDGTFNYLFSDTVLNTSEYNFLLVDSNSNFILTGNCQNIDGSKNALVISYRGDSKLNWQTCLDATEDQSINHMIIENNHLYGVGFTYELNNGNKDYYMVELDLNGNLIKKSIPNYYPNDDEEAFYISKTQKGFGIIAGTKSIGESPGKNDFQFIEVTTNGTLIDGYNYGWENIDTPTNFLIDSSGFLLFGNTNSIGNGYGDYVVIDVNENYSKTKLVFENPQSPSPILISNIEEELEKNELTIDRIKVFDLSGRMLYNGTIFPNNERLPNNQILIFLYYGKDSITAKKIFVGE